jgi:hypothetical protein
MVWGLLADAVLLVHLGFVVFVVLGGLLVLQWRGVAWAHLPAAVWGVGIELSGAICPLTPLENWLRERGGVAGYEGGFIDHYLLPVLYPAGLTRPAQWGLAVVVLAVNAAVYVAVWRRHRAGLRGGRAANEHST